MASKKDNLLALTEELAAIIGAGYKLEREIRAGLREDMVLKKTVFRYWRFVSVDVLHTLNPTARALYQVVIDIEAWRTTAGIFLRDKLPGTGANVFGLSKFGEVGHGPTRYEYSRLCNSIDRLTSVLRHLPELVERSRGK